MPTPLEATRHNNLTKLLVLLPLRANLKRTFQCETPCMIFFSDMGISTIKNENYLENVVAQPAKYQIPDAYKGNNPKARRS